MKNNRLSLRRIISSSIKAKILSASIALILLALVTTGLLSTFLNLYASNMAAEKSFEQIINAAAYEVKTEMDKMSSLINEISANYLFQDAEVKDPTVSAFLKAKAEEHGFKNIYFTDMNGNSNVGANFAEYEFFIEASKGNTYLTAPQISADGTYADIMLSSPVRNTETNEVVGTICAVLDSVILSDMVSLITIGDTGTLYIIDSEGYTIADPEYSYVLSHENTILASEEDKSLLAFAEYEKQALAGEAVYGTMYFESERCYMAAVPIEDTDGWVLGGYAPAMEFIGATVKTGVMTAVLIVLSIAASALIMNRLAKKISAPIVAISDISTELANGNFDAHVDYTAEDEIGVMANNFRNMIHTNGAIIQDVSNVMTNIAQGNLTVSTSSAVDYRGSFTQIKAAAEQIIASLSGMIRSMSDMSMNVTSGSDQVASGAMSLSQGSQEQAAAIEELAASMQDISAQVDNNAKNAAYAKDLSSSVKEGILKSNDNMHELNSAIEQIQKKQDEIMQIIKTIDDIAFQTNILALNAAVEAARAGAAGKGFAVVADEVRSLAQKVAEASKTTTGLITANDAAVKTGSSIAQETMQGLNSVVQSTLEVVEKINEISDACIDQATRLDEASIGVEQVSAVVQSNSATAEECAAVSESMSKQAASLQNMVQQFTI